MLTSKIDSLILQEFYNHYNSETNSYIDILEEEKTNPKEEKIDKLYGEE